MGVSPLSGWLGGKRLLAQRIIPMIPDHRTYCEAFAGGAWVLFLKAPSKVEVLNDLNRDVITLYRVVQAHLDEFVRYFRWVLMSRSEFERWMKLAPEALTDIQRAARFYYLHRLSFSGRMNGRPSLPVRPDTNPPLNLLRIEEELSAAHLRLARVFIEHLPYGEVIRRYDRKATFFYLDPPYWGKESFYGEGLFQRSDYERLAEQLAGLRGKFLLSLNDTEGVRDVFQAFSIRAVRTPYSCAPGGNRMEGREVLIQNY